MEKKCFLCGRNGLYDPLDRHHIFPGANRSNSEKYGLVVYLCHSDCHIYGPNAVHRNPDVMKMLKKWGQRKAMKENGWTKKDFIKVFGRNYLEEE